MAVREFDGTDDDIITAVGGLSAMTFGTIGVIIKPTSITGPHSFFTLHTSAPAGVCQAYTENNDFRFWNGVTNPAGHIFTAATNRWYCVVFRKGTGTVTGRWSVYDYTAASWSHTAQGGTQANWTAPGGSGTVRQSFEGSAEFCQARVAVRAVWANSLPWTADSSGDTAIEGEGLEDTLQAWIDASPTALWPYNQASVADDLLDTIGAADETSITGTTVVTGDDPLGFSFGGGGTSTGEKFPTSGTTTNESPWLDEPWVNPGNVVSNNATYAAVTATTFDLGDQTAVLKATGFDFSSIPSGATIDGVTCRIEARGDSTSVSLDLVQLLNTSGAKVGTNLASTPQALTTSDTVYTFGSSSNLWGNSLTEAWVKDADFGVAIGAICSVNNSEVYVDYVTLEIQYTASSGATATPAVIARSFTAPAAGAGVGAAPAVIARAVTTPLAGIGTTATPAVIARSFTAPQTQVSVAAVPAVTARVFVTPQATPDSGAGPATVTPAVIARSFTTPQAVESVGAAPVVTARSFTLPAATADGGGVAGAPLFGAQLGVPTAQPGSFQLGTTPAVSGNVNAAPSVVARSFTLPQATVSVGAAPAVVPTVAALPQATAGVGANVVQTVIARIFTTPQLAVSVGAAPTVIARVFVAPQAAVSSGAAPAVITRVLVLPQALVDVGASLGILAALTAMPAATTVTGAVAAPAVIPLAVVIPQASIPGAGGATTTPLVIARVVTAPQTVASIGAAPAVINVGVTTPQPAESIGAAPALIVRAVVVPQSAASVGAALSTIARAFTLPLATSSSDTTVTATVIARLFAMPQATGDGGAVTGTGQPAVIALAVTVPQLVVSVQARPLVIARSFIVPAASVFSLGFGNPAVIARAFTVPQPAVGVGVTATVIARAFTIAQALAVIGEIGGTLIVTDRDLTILTSSGRTVTTLASADRAVSNLIGGVSP